MFIIFLQHVQLVLSLSLYLATVFAQSSHFNINAHGTGYRYSASTGGVADGIGVTTSDDLSYTVDITLGGQNYTVLLDTGSSDLWVNTDSPHQPKLTNTTNLATELIYGSGDIKGTIDFAELRIGDFIIDSQAFINPTSISDFDTSDVDGIMGMAFDVGNVYTAIQQAWGTDAADTLGRAPVTNLFAQNTSLPNNFDVHLGRSTQTDDVAEGTFIISGHAPAFASVTSAPQLQRVDRDHWSLVMDAMHVNGKAFTFNQSRIAGVPAGTVVAALDTGFSFPPLPAPAVDAIYSTIPGALFDPVAQLWIVPCTSATNLSFVFAGQEFFVHPLDLTLPIVTQLSVNGSLTNVTTCINTYQYLTLDPSSFVGFDLILGDAFLRNVYASFDYGDYYPTNRTNGLPFVQMVTTTEPSRMWREFARERTATLVRLPREARPSDVVKYDSQQGAQSGASDVSGAVSSNGSSTASADGDVWAEKYGPAALGLLAANLLVGIALLGVTLTMCVRGVKGKKARVRGAGAEYAAVLNEYGASDDYDGWGPSSILGIFFCENCLCPF